MSNEYLNEIVKCLALVQDSVENERTFSKMNKIQNKFTNKITPKHLYYRTLIYAKKVSVENFDFDRAL